MRQFIPTAKSMKLKNFTVFLFLLLLASYLNAESAAGISANGEELFRNNCAACHIIGRELIGPNLTSINSKMPKTWLIAFIRNSQSVIKSGDPYAVKLFSDYKQVIMPETKFSDPEIQEILNYVEARGKLISIAEKTESKPSFIPPVESIKKKPFFLQTRILICAAIVLLFAFFLLSQWIFKLLKKDIRNLSSFARFVYNPGYFFRYRLSALFYIVSFSAILLIVLIPISRDYAVKTAQMQPQPVEFSHISHYDSFKTDCRFCHPGAVKSDFAGLPGINNCMKCHNYITGGKKYGKNELNKLTTIAKNREGIYWATAYRFSDYVHFNHANHTVTAKIECTTCHNLTENMEIRKENVSMRWCISCHQKSEIIKNGKYYHKALDTNLFHQVLKVSETGGMDCSACHY